jgi:hypothetical protein
MDYRHTTSLLVIVNNIWNDLSLQAITIIYLILSVVLVGYNHQIIIDGLINLVRNFYYLITSIIGLWYETFLVLIGYSVGKYFRFETTV